jgi:hypothetical protein
MGLADGLLERKVLLLAPRDASGRRTIVDPETAAPIGFCQRRPRLGWWSRFARRVMSVHELLDESLLCSVRRCWSLFSWYEVRDADDQVVGWHGGPLVVNRSGRHVAVREEETETGTSWIVGTKGATLARLARQEDDVCLSFTEEVSGQPFVKMLLLAAALRW